MDLMHSTLEKAGVIKTADSSHPFDAKTFIDATVVTLT